MLKAAPPPQLRRSPRNLLQPNLLRPSLLRLQSAAQSAPQADGAPAAQQPPATEKSAPVQEEKSSAPAGSNGGAGIDVVMPQMGESIFEGTITKWLKKVGDKVQRDEPLFEISTDKVDAEIPAPAAGVLREIKVKEGTTVQVNSVVAVIGGAGGAGTSCSGKAAGSAAQTSAPGSAAAGYAVSTRAATAASGPAAAGCQLPGR